MRLGKLLVNLKHSEKIGEYISIQANNRDAYLFDYADDKVTLRITLATAAKLAEFIDEALEDTIKSYKKESK